MTAPSYVTDRLKSEFGNRLRIRWSYKRSEWQIEAKVARAVEPGSHVDSADDDHIRARDGYAFVLSIRQGDRMPCPDCGFSLRVPVLRTEEVRCDYCRSRGRDGRHRAAYYPLDSEKLFEHLRMIDPQRGYRTNLHRLADQRNQAILAAREREAMNKVQSATLDNFNRMVGIPQFGYSGKTQAWVDAPDSLKKKAS
jgi:hypothetical protein